MYTFGISACVKAHSSYSLADITAARSLELYIPDIGVRARGKDSYLVAEDLADWLTRTKRLSIHGGFSDLHEPDGTRVVTNKHTWSLLRRIAANFTDLEHLSISRECWGLYVPSILQCFNCPKLKVLNVNGISEWKDGSVELEREVRESPLTTLLVYAARVLIRWT